MNYILHLSTHFWVLKYRKNPSKNYLFVSNERNMKIHFTIKQDEPNFRKIRCEFLKETIAFIITKMVYLLS